MKKKVCCKCGKFLRSKLIIDRANKEMPKVWCYKCFRLWHGATRIDSKQGYKKFN